MGVIGNDRGSPASRPEGLIDAAFDANPLPMGVYDAETLRFLAVNDAAVVAYGYSREQFLTLTLLDVRPPNDRPSLEAYALVRDPAKAYAATGPRTHMRADGTVMQVEVANSRRFTYGDRQAFLATVFDLTERDARNEAEAERLRLLAFTDPSTGLLNRAALLAEFGHDGFQFGELVLVRITWVIEAVHRSQAARVLTAGAIAAVLLVVAPDGAIVFRYSDQAFAILTKKTEPTADPLALAQHIAAEFDQPLSAGGESYVVIPTIGIAAATGPESTIADLARRSEAALHEAERAHDRIAVYTDRLQQSHDRRATIERSLRRALQEEQLGIVYQPFVSLATGEIVGAEALMRWVCPGIGPVAPDEFIAIAEDSGVILRLGEWILRAACSEAMEWQRAGFGRLRIAVNVSARQVEQHDFVRIVESACDAAGLAPADLELEITERVVVHRDGPALHNLEALRERGVRIAIDDFGTGYSSLSYLSTLPLDTLKLDRTFVVAADRDPFQAKVAASVVTLALDRGLTVVGEGVEMSRQRDWLRTIGCHEAQGYLFGVPATAGEFRRRLSLRAQHALLGARD